MTAARTGERSPDVPPNQPEPRQTLAELLQAIPKKERERAGAPGVFSKRRRREP